MTKEERRAHWRTIIEDQTTRGLNIADFCRDRQIRLRQFHAWRRRFRGQPLRAGGFLELLPEGVTGTESGIRIHPGRNLIIEVDRGFDPLTLRSVIETLRITGWQWSVAELPVRVDAVVRSLFLQIPDSAFSCT